MQLANALDYLYLMSTFRNGLSLVRAARGGPLCQEAVLWNGQRVSHPAGRDGFVGTILELWKEQCYTRDGFYEPAEGDQIIDAGAHVGLFSIWLARPVTASTLVECANGRDG